MLFSFPKFFTNFSISIVLLTTLTFGQLPESIVWSTEQWEKGMQSSATYQSGTETFLVTWNTESGNIVFYALNENGIPARKTWEVNGEKGIKSITSFDRNGTDYLFVSNPDEGKIWIYQLLPDGKLGTAVWANTAWLKGITVASHFEIADRDYLFLSQPKTGAAYVIKLGDNGSLELQVWSTGMWDTGITAASTVFINGQLYLLVANTAAGIVWTYQMNDDGTVGTVVGSPAGLGVTGEAMTTYTVQDEGYLMLSNPASGKAWVYSISSNGRVNTLVWQTGKWESGISGVIPYSVGKNQFLLVVKPESGKAWVLGLKPVETSNVVQSINELIPQDESFFIQSALTYGKNDEGYWDIPGGKENIKTLAPLKVWALQDVGQDRKYMIENSQTPGFVRIHIENIAGYVDIKDGNNSNGAKLQIYSSNNNSAQNFTFVYMGEGRFKIFAQNGKLITLDNRSSANGTDLHMWDDHDGPWTEWVLISTSSKQPLLLDNKIKKLRSNVGVEMPLAKQFYIQSAMCYGKNLNGFFDVPGRNYPEKGNSIQVYALWDYDADRRFSIVPSRSHPAYYSVAIAGNNRLLLDVANGSTANGTPIGLWELNNSSAQNFSFKSMGNGRYKIFNQNGKVLCVNNRSSENGTRVHLWDDHNGPWTEWYFIEATTNKPLGVAVSGSTKEIANPVNATAEQQQLFTDIDKTFEQVTNLESLTAEVLTSVQSVYTTVNGVSRVSNNMGSLLNKVSTTYSALEPFSILPVIGPPAKMLANGLNISRSQLDKVQNGFLVMKAPVLDPAFNNVSFTTQKVMALHAQLQVIKSGLYQLKQKSIANLNRLKNADGSSNVAAVKAMLTKVQAPLPACVSALTAVRNACTAVKKLESPVAQVNNGIENFERVFSKTDRVAEQINSVLDKRYKKEVDLQLKKVGIDVSVREVISGGVVGEAFDKFVNPWLQEIIRPVMDKLQVQLPEIPGIDKFKTAMQESLEFTKKMHASSKEIEVASQGLTLPIEGMEKNFLK